MTWDLGVHLATSPRCLRNLVVSLVSRLITERFLDHMTLLSCDALCVSRLVTERFLDHMTLLSCDALCLVTASASLWGT